MDTHRPLRGRTLGARIKEAYEGAGLSRAAFQRKLQAHDPALGTLNYKTIVDWEQGSTPRLKVLRAIASVLGYNLEDLSSDPESAEEAEVGVLDETQIAELIDKLGGSEKVKSEVAYELTAYPPRGGITREEVVRVHRLVSRAYALPIAPEPPENAKIDAEIKGLGYKNVEPNGLRRNYAEKLASPPETPAKTRRRRNDG